MLSDGFAATIDLGSPEPKDRQTKKIVIIRLLPKSTCKFLHPDIGIFFPKSQATTSVKSECRNLHLDLGNTPPSTQDIVKIYFCLNQGADFCTLSSAKKICALHSRDIWCRRRNNGENEYLNKRVIIMDNIILVVLYRRYMWAPP